MATPLRRATLDNGLTVLVQEEHTAPLVSVWCWYKVGSKDERPGLTGAAHWVEHMNFKGTTNIPREQVKGIIEQFGGTWNGYTWIDQTTYLETAAREALDRMLFIESERMANGLYDPADCESERTVIISELQGGENDPDQVLDQEVTAAAFKAHPYKHPTIGWLSDLQTMTRDDLFGFYRRYYVPNNATLVIVGDVEAGDAIARADRYFGRIPPGDSPARVRTTEPDQLGERRVTVRKAGTTAYLKVAYHAPAVMSPDFFPALVLDATLTGAKGLNLWSSFRLPPSNRKTRVYRALVERGLASNVFGALLPTEQPFLYMISATVTEGVSLPAAEAALLETLEEVRHSGVTDLEVERARKHLHARLVFEGDSITNIAHQLGYFETVARAELALELDARIQATTPEQVRAVAHRLLDDTRRTVGWFDPLPLADGHAHPPVSAASGS